MQPKTGFASVPSSCCCRSEWAWSERARQLSKLSAEDYIIGACNHFFFTKRKELWLCANGRFRMRSGMRNEGWLCANGNILGCAVIWRKELCANGWVRMCREPCAFLWRFSLLLIFFRSLLGYLKDCNVVAHSVHSDIFYVVINLFAGSKSFIITLIS